MRGVNKVILVATLGRDPETRYLPNGKAVTNFTVATNEEWKDKQTGQKQTKTEWHRIVTFDKLAEIAGQYLAKGASVYLEGKLQTREWEKDGVKRYTTEIVCDQMQMMGGKGEGQQQGKPDQQQPKPQQSQQGKQGPDDFDDDIPFAPLHGINAI